MPITNDKLRMCTKNGNSPSRTMRSIENRNETNFSCSQNISLPASGYERKYANFTANK